MDKMITAKGVKKGFPVAGGEIFWALKGLDLEIPKGQLAILKGRSGSGKTTLMNILSALDYPTEGDVFFQGANIAQMSEKERSLLRRKKTGFVFQSVALVPMMTAYENVEFALRLAKYPGNRRARAEECLKMVGLGVCMGNGQEATKAVADYVAPHIDDDGLLKAVEYILSQNG